MITIKDIAKAANVSVGTVSNVLNGKSSVSLAKIRKVEEAISQLGYKRNLQAARLKKGESHKMAFIVPSIVEEQYAVLFETLTLLLTKKGYQLDLYISFYRPELERKIMGKIAQESYYAVLTVSMLQEQAEYLAEFSHTDTRIAFVYRSLKGKQASFNANYLERLSELKETLKSNDRVLLLAEEQGSFDFKVAQQFESQFVDNVAECGIVCRADYQVKNCFSVLPELEGNSVVIAPSQAVAWSLYQAFQLSVKPVPRLITFGQAEQLEHSPICYYPLNYDRLAEQIVAWLFDEKVKQANAELPLLPNKFLPTMAKNLHILAVKSPSIEALRQLLADFSQQTDTQVHIHLTEFKDLPQTLSDNPEQYDLVRIDMESLPYFADYFEPLTFVDKTQLSALFSEHIIQRFALHRGKIIALPFDPSIQMLYYRRDIFEDAKIRRHYYERYKTELAVPSTFAEFNQIAEFFSQDWEDNPFKAGTTLITDDIGVLASEFLLRYYSEAKSILNQNRLKLNVKAAKNALKNIKQLQTSAILLQDGWWKEAVNEFAQGHIPMGIVYMNHFAYYSENRADFTVGFAPVPSKVPLLGGGSLAVVKNSEKKTACEQFLHWLLTERVHAHYIRLGGISAKSAGLGIVETERTAPYLQFAHTQQFRGIRENQTNDGEALNLRQIETIIGSYVKQYLELEINENELVQQLNQDLQKISIPA